MKYQYKAISVMLLMTTLSICGCTSECRTPNSREDNEPVIFLSPLSGIKTGSTLLIVNMDGDTLKMKKSDVLASNFKKWEYEGKTRYSYSLEDTGFHKLKDRGYFPGYMVITDTGFNELKRIRLMPYGNIDATAQPGVDYHDFILLADNHYIVQAYYEHAPDNIPTNVAHSDSMRVITPVLQEVLDDKVIWQWVGTDFPELYAISLAANDSGVSTLDTDYLHINSILIDPKDSNLIVSCRKSNQLLKLNRKQPGIIWKMGGSNSDFYIPDSMMFLRQHHVTLPEPGTIMMVDNGDAKKRNYSYITEIDIDEYNRKIKEIRRFKVPGDFIQFGGSVQKLEDTYFIGGGSAAYIMEVNRRTKVKKFEMKLPKGTYRAIRYE